MPPGFDKEVEAYYKAKEPFDKLLEEASVNNTSKHDDTKKEDRPQKREPSYVNLPKKKTEAEEAATTAKFEAIFGGKSITEIAIETESKLKENTTRKKGMPMLTKR